VLLCYLKQINGKSLCLSLQTADPGIAKRHMRLLVSGLLYEERLSPDSQAAKVYGPNGAERSRLKKFSTDVRRLKALPEAKYGSEALAVAKRWGCPVGIIHHLAGRKPALSAGTYATRRMRARERGRQTPIGDTWEHRPQGGKAFFWNGNVLTARLQIDRRTWQWSLKAIDEEDAEALMARVRVARNRLRRTAAEELNCELGTEEAVAATAARFGARAELASAIRRAGGPKKLVDFVLMGPQEGVGSAVPEPVVSRRAERRRTNKGAREKCVQRYIKLIRTYPDGPPEPREVLARKMMNELRVTWHEARACRGEAIKRTGNLNWSRHGRPRR
jgi:hypothetical protein